MASTVQLISWTAQPVETVYRLWEASKTRDSMAEIDARFNRAKAKELFRKVLQMGIPVGESIDFVFMLDGVSISFREQMVRHRIGAKVGDRLGVDFVPDLADSRWWAQSMRILDMSEFANDGAYREPDFEDEDQMQVFRQAMHEAQEAYKALVGMGMPHEEAREVIPLGATHRISWALNLQALRHICSKRSCWILQGGLWHPIIEGMVRELAEKVDPIFRELVTPPCIKGDEYVGCPYDEDNRRRAAGDDPLTPCSLWWNYEGGRRAYVGEPVKPSPSVTNRYANFWGRNAATGKRFALEV